MSAYYGQIEQAINKNNNNMNNQPDSVNYVKSKNTILGIQGLVIEH